MVELEVSWELVRTRALTSERASGRNRKSLRANAVRWQARAQCFITCRCGAHAARDACVVGATALVCVWRCVQRHSCAALVLLWLLISMLTLIAWACHMRAVACKMRMRVRCVSSLALLAAGAIYLRRSQIGLEG